MNDVAWLMDIILGDVEVPTDAEDLEEYLTEVAEVLRSGVPKRVADRLEEKIRSLRLERGVCPDCGEALEAATEEATEWHPYGMGYAPERRVEFEGWECPMCGARYAPEEVGIRS